MSMHGYGSWVAVEAPLDARVAFVRRTYLHLAGAIAAFVALSWALYQADVGVVILSAAASSRYAWLLILGAFTLVGYGASALARSDQNIGVQYLGLAGYTVAEALIFSPLIYLAARMEPGILPNAACLTLLIFSGLSLYVVTSKKDFSFLRGALAVGFWVALGLIVCGALFGLSLGLWFSGAMVLFASMAILYSTSRVLRNYRTDQHVAAALELFAAVALLFWYVLRILMSLQRR